MPDTTLMPAGSTLPVRGSSEPGDRVWIHDLTVQRSQIDSVLTPSQVEHVSKLSFEFVRVRRIDLF